MQELLCKLFLLIVCLFLVACTSNTKSENTAIGAVSGGVVGGLLGSAIGQGAGSAVAVGAGAIAGALVGGAIGYSMDSADNTRVSDTLDNNPTYKATSWVNEKTGTRYTVIPTSNTMAIKGNKHCRQYRTIAIVGEEKRHMYGVACKQPNGEWQSVDA